MDTMEKKSFLKENMFGITISLGMAVAVGSALYSDFQSARHLPEIVDIPISNAQTLVSLEAKTVTQVTNQRFKVTADFEEDMFCKTTMYSTLCKSFSEVKDPANKAKIEEMRNVLKSVTASPSF